VNGAVERLRQRLRDDLGDELVGLYLSGSLALGGFDQASSDVDVLAATSRVLPQAALDRLASLHAALKAPGGWTARLEVGTCRWRPCAALIDPIGPEALRASVRLLLLGFWVGGGRSRGSPR
jgi:predicted nucleotidyltransferase